jgi:hypothetical protein
VFGIGFCAGCRGRPPGRVFGTGFRTACLGLASGPDVWAWLPDRVFGPGFRIGCLGQAAGPGVGGGFRVGYPGRASGAGFGLSSGRAFGQFFGAGVRPGRPGAGAGAGPGFSGSDRRRAGWQVGAGWLVERAVGGPGQAPRTGRQHGSRQLAGVPKGSIRPVRVCLLRSYWAELGAMLETCGSAGEGRTFPVIELLVLKQADVGASVGKVRPHAQRSARPGSG